MPRLLTPLAGLLLALTLSAPGAEPAAAAQGRNTLAPKAKPPADAGAKDPADFPRAPGLVRTTYSQAAGKLREEEIATYHAEAGLDEVAAQYLERLQAAQWKKGSDTTSGTDIHRVRIIEWTTPAKDAEVRFYALKGSGSDLRVRVFTYPAKLAARPDTTAAVSTAPKSPATANRGAALSRQLGVAPVGPPPTNIAVVCDGDAASHKISWDAKDWVDFDVLRETLDGWVTVAEKVTQTNAHESALVQPNTKFRVVVRHTDGSQGSADYAWPTPPHWATASVLQGNDRTPIVITHNLGWPQRECNFNPPPTGGYGWPGKPYVSSWTATSALVQLRYMPGVPQFNGTIEILPPPGQSEVIRIPFTWMPRYETQVMTLEETYLNSLTNTGPSLPGSPELPESLKHLVATTDSHVSGPGLQLNVSYIQYDFFGLFGDKGDDEFFTQLHLAPNWTVESVEISPRVWLGKGNATIVDSRVGTDSPYVKVHWWADLQSSLTYSIKIKVRGPEGGRPLNWKVLPAR